MASKATSFTPISATTLFMRVGEQRTCSILRWLADTPEANGKFWLGADSFQLVLDVDVDEPVILLPSRGGE